MIFLVCAIGAQIIFMSGIFGAPHEGAERRETVSAVIQRKSDNKFLLLKWKRFGWIAPSVGGIEKGETPLEAAEREVLEETGYRAKAVRKLGSVVESHFFAENKNVWRHRIDQPVLLELLSEEPVVVATEEKDMHEAVWMSYKEALEKMTHKENTTGICRHLGLKEPASKK